MSHQRASKAKRDQENNQKIANSDFNQRAGVSNSLQFASVQDSREGLFISSLNNGLNSPVPPKFQFQPRQGRINWRQIMNMDIDRIIKSVDLR